jgi:integrase
MAGTVQEAEIGTRAKRARLKKGRQPHWRALVQGKQIHLGWQRWPDDQEGRWLLRRYLGNGRYRMHEIGKADDHDAADGDRVLDFDQAEEKARAAVGAKPGKRDKLTVRDAMKLYLKAKGDDGKPTEDIEGRANFHILPMLGDCLVADLTSEQLRRWRTDLANSPAHLRSPKKGERNMRQAQDAEAIRRRRVTANRTLTCLKACLNHAFKEKLVASDDAWRGNRVALFAGVNVAKIRFLAVEEAQRLLNACEPDFRVLVQGALQTGMRYGELCRLTVADFAARLHRQADGSSVEVGTLAVLKSKTGKSRHVHLTAEGIAFFRTMTAGRAGDQLMFRHADGTPWGESHQSERMRQACDRAKIAPRIGFHILRHTWASLAVMAGMPMMVAARNLGHRDTKMVERHYGHLSDEYVISAIHSSAPKFGFVPDDKVVPLAKAGR